jgi:hypothetical protein
MSKFPSKSLRQKRIERTKQGNEALKKAGGGRRIQHQRVRRGGLDRVTVMVGLVKRVMPLTVAVDCWDMICP